MTTRKESPSVPKRKGTRPTRDSLWWMEDGRSTSQVKTFDIDRIRARKIAMLIATKTPAPEMVRKLRGFGLDVPLKSKSFAVDVAFDPYRVQLRVSEKPLSIQSLKAGERK